MGGTDVVNVPMSLAELLVKSADSLGEYYDIDSCLEGLVTLAQHLVPGSDVSVHVRVAGEAFATSRASSSELAAIDQYQFDQAVGPGPETLRSGRPAGSTRLGAPGYPFPAFARLARAVGYRRVSTFPMAWRSETIGVLTVAERTPSADDRGVALLSLLAEGVCLGYLNRRALLASHELSRQLQTALHSRIVIEQAKGVVAARLGISVDEAFEALRAHARQNNRNLHEVSRDVTTGRLDLRHLRAALARRAQPGTGARAAGPIEGPGDRLRPPGPSSPTRRISA